MGYEYDSEARGKYRHRGVSAYDIFAKTKLLFSDQMAHKYSRRDSSSQTRALDGPLLRRNVESSGSLDVKKKGPCSDTVE